MKTAKNISLSILGFAFISIVTSGVHFRTEKVRLGAELRIPVPGAIIEKNIEKAMLEFNSMREREIFKLFPGQVADEAQDAASTPLTEGFNSAPAGLPAAVAPMWNATLMVMGADDSGVEIGSGVVAKMVDTQNGNSNLYVLTNNHVIKDFCDRDGQCPRLLILNDMGVDSATGDIISTGNNLLRLTGVTLMHTSADPDLALLQVTIDAATKSVLQVAHFQTMNPPAADEVFAIGFPNTALRTSSKNPIDQQNFVIKRWSTGQVANIMNMAGYGDLVIHSADILPGSSGSGLYDNSGAVVGLNVLLINPDADFDYTGGGCGKPLTQRAAVAPSMLTPFLNFLNSPVQ